jgi:hypothetical protein
MDSVELSSIQAVSPTLAETIRECQLRAGLSRIPRSYDFILGNPKAWLGTAYHEVLERIEDVDFSRESFDAALERLWEVLSLYSTSAACSTHLIDGMDCL